jgi:anti-sigma factor ChrR (cupin superfamily)
MSYPSRYVNSGDLPWRETPYSGVLWKKLYFEPESGHSAVLLKFEAGASYGAHLHPEGEEYLVLEGTLDDGGRTYGPGTYVHHPPGSVHAPTSEDGCLLFVRLPRPIEMVDG